VTEIQLGFAFVDEILTAARAIAAMPRFGRMPIWSIPPERMVLIAILASAALGGCERSQRSRGAREQEAAPDARVESAGALAFSGCHAVVDGPVCELPPDRALRIWLDAADAKRASFATDRGPLAAPEMRDVRGGSLARVVIPAQASWLRVRIGAERALALRVTEGVPVPDAVQRARDLREREKLDAAASLLEAEWGALPPSALGAALGVRARIELARGDVDRAEGTFLASIARHESEGRLSEAADDAFALVHTYIGARRFATARLLLARAARMCAAYPDGQARVAYYEGALARGTGDAGTALRRLRDAELLAARLGLTRLWVNAKRAYAGALMWLGRAPEAMAILVDLKGRDDLALPPCARADLIQTLGWNALVARESAPDAEAAARSLDPRPLLDEALALYDATCPNPRERASTLANLARAALQTGDLAAARARLRDARSAVTTLEPQVAVDCLAIEGALALASRDPASAVRVYERYALLAAGTGSVADELIAAEGRAAALAALRDVGGALAASAAAERLVESEARWVPLGEGRATFLTTREAGVRLHVELLLASGRPADAMAASRRAGRRLLASFAWTDALEHLEPQARARWDDAVAAYAQGRDAIEKDAAGDWALSVNALERAVEARHVQNASIRAALEETAAALLGADRGAGDASPPAPEGSDVELVYQPLRDGWVGFAVTRAGTRAVRLREIATDALPDALAAKLLAPFAGEIDGAARVSILAHARLAAIDFHALPWRGAPLGEHAVVDYPIDSPKRAAERGAPGALALVIADPNGDLPAARREARAIRPILGGAWSTEILEGSAADRHAALARMPRATLLHFAGHGAFAGRGGADSVLPLASEGAHTLGDVLALGHAPRFVVLSACESARTTRDPSSSGGLGIAQAFLLAGTETAIAAVRPVNDASAARLMSELYAALRGPAEADLARALADAQRAVRKADPALDGAAFRALRR
jgi:hypothetical protein